MGENNGLVVTQDGTIVSDEEYNGEVNTSLAKMEPASLAALADSGFIMPLIEPEQLRQAFAMKQRLYADILDPYDYLYVVEGKDQMGKTRQFLYQNRADAMKAASTYMTVVRASPKKSGIVKLARALGIRAVLIMSEERTIHGTRGWFVQYEALHERTGLRETGSGWCDQSERGGKISIHQMMGTADTRAYNRAILRLSGFGDVSADEIVAGASDENDQVPTQVPSVATKKVPDPLPSLNDPQVIAAATAWAEAFASSKAAPEAQQVNLDVRELRASARRGAITAATALGIRGMRWSGPASDGPGFDTIMVEESPVSPARVTPQAPPPQAVPQATTGETAPGWGLSGKGDDDKSDESEESEHQVPAPDMKAESITTAQAKKVSALLLKMFSNSADARKWLKKVSQVERTTHLRTNQYENLMTAIAKEASSHA